jgi:tRNA U55 pseudouridine synthase TruB
MPRQNIKVSQKLPKYFVLNKKRGQTPLELLQQLKSSRAELADVPLSYAGRLDPMAEGKMLALVGDECKRQAKYTDLDKEYEVTILLGAKTDTGDLLGLVDMFAKSSPKDMLNSSASSNIYNVYTDEKLLKAIKRELGSHSRKYPAFSSKTVQGKPLFLYTLENRLQEIQIPEHIETFYKISFNRKNNSNGKDNGRKYFEPISANELQKRILDALAVVPRSDEPSKRLGEDFRQDVVRARWNEFFVAQKKTEEAEFFLLHVRVTCGSGAYMRTLAERIGSSLGVPALAFSINRTKMGRFIRIGPSGAPSFFTGFWIRQYYATD